MTENDNRQMVTMQVSAEMPLDVAIERIPPSAGYVLIGVDESEGGDMFVPIYTDAPHDTEQLRNLYLFLAQLLTRAAGEENWVEVDG